MEAYDFSGWATRNDIRCADGKTIRRNAFKNNDGKKVPLVWMHSHGDVRQVLGHALLENREDGVYAYGSFNDTEEGQAAKKLVKHGDITSLSIWANRLAMDDMRNVLHGDIKEVSLVLAGANEGAVIEEVLEHSEDGEEQAMICMNMPLTVYMAHSDDEDEDPDEDEDKKKKSEEDNESDDSEKDEKKSEEDSDDDDDKEVKHADNAQEEEGKKVADNEKTVKDVYDSMTEEQKKVCDFLVGTALEEGAAKHSDDEGGEEMKHNLFASDVEGQENVLSHDDMAEIFGDVKRYGTLKESFIAHGVENLEVLFPDEKSLNPTPEFIKRDMDWVDKVMNGVHKTPFSRIKSIFADITEDDARAKGYIKGNFKKEEVFTLLKRTTSPTTIYKKQKFDRDDLIDIDFDAVPWIKAEMRMMLNEEIARAIIVGDGRPSSSDDHINEQNIRPIWKDEDLFTIKVTLDSSVDVTDPDAVAKNFIRKEIKSRKLYKGSGNPTLFTTEDMLTDMLLLTDNDGRDLYDSVEKLKNKLRVSDIVTVPVMENLTRVDGADTKALLGIVVNLKDYNYGADKGGGVALFDDFDIDYNAQKYLIETRGSGALIKPFSAIVIEAVQGQG